MSEKIYVPGTGDRNANIVFLGEAPGAKEETQRLPFVGPSGALFRSALDNKGIRSDRSYITNVCHYRPPYNDIEKFLKRSTRKKAPTVRILEPLLAEGIAELFRDLAEIKPNVIVPMGNVGLWALTGEWGITRYRGSTLEVSWDLERARALSIHDQLSEELIENLKATHGMKVVPTYHPASILREYKNLSLFLTDLGKAAKNSLYPELRLPERTFHINPPTSVLDELVDELLSSPIMAFDIECVGTKLFCVGFSCDPSWALTLTTNSPENNIIIRHLLTSDVPKVAQNGIFDVSYLQRFNGLSVRNLTADTMVAQHVSYAELPKGLDTLASIYTDEPYWKDEGKDWKATDTEDLQRFLEYNGKDTAVTLETWLAMQEAELSKLGRKEHHDFIMKQIPAYSRMTYSGALLDTYRMRELRDEYERDYLELQRGLDNAVMAHLYDVAEVAEKKGNTKAVKKISSFLVSIMPGKDTNTGALNVNSSKILKEYLYEIRGFKVKTVKNNAGQKVPTTREKALKELFMETGDPFLLTIVKIRQKRKRIGTYLNLKHDGTGRVYWSVNPVRAETGRSACGKTILQEGTNVQTIPHELREIIIAPPGYILSYLDYAQAEARIVAYFAGIRRMISAFESEQSVKFSPTDVHSLTAHQVLGVAYEDMKEIPHRFLGKKCNHAFNYEMGPYLFWEEIMKTSDETGVHITRTQAIAMRKKHFQTYPELQGYWREIRGLINATRTITNPFGRTRLFLGRKEDATYREGFSHYAQSTVRDLIGHAIIRTDRDVMEPLRRAGHTESRIVLEGHDALLVQLPEEHEEEAVKKTKEAMTIPFEVKGREILIPVDSKSGHNWGELE
jgi:DNA polymerase